jgi:cold shock CspA family protein
MYTRQQESARLAAIPREPLPVTTLLVKSYNAAHGFGFGVPLDAPLTGVTSNRHDVFLHQMHIACGPGPRSLTPGQRVQAQIVEETSVSGKVNLVGKFITPLYTPVRSTQTASDFYGVRNS